MEFLPQGKEGDADPRDLVTSQRTSPVDRASYATGSGVVSGHSNRNHILPQTEGGYSARSQSHLVVAVPTPKGLGFALGIGLSLVIELCEKPQPHGARPKPDRRTASAQLVWKCGRKNPGMFGTFGNGCLKQLRAWKKGQH